MRHIVTALLICIAVSGCASRKTTEQATTATAETPAAPASASTSADADVLRDEANNRVYFSYDSWNVSDAAAQVLRRQAAWLAANPSVSVVIEGHCDERGTREYNLGLGERRAHAVRTFLVSAGVESGRIRTISYGKDRPEAAGSTDEAWWRNRRAVTAIAQ